MKNEACESPSQGELLGVRFGSEACRLGSQPAKSRLVVYRLDDANAEHPSGGAVGSSCIDFAKILISRSWGTEARSSIGHGVRGRRKDSGMKGPHRRVLKSDAVAGAVSWFAARLATMYLRTVRLYVAWENPELHPSQARENCIYCTWHENILMWVYVGAFQDVAVLVSASDDGELITRIIGRLGYRAVRGSSRRGAVQALKGLLRAGTATHVAITPDGPLGPRQVFQLGAVYLASRNGLKLVPTSFAFDRPWRAPTWDQHAIPRPFSKVVHYAGAPIVVPADADAEQLAHYQRLAGEAICRATAEAERLLGGVIEDSKFKRIEPGNYVPEQALGHSRGASPPWAKPHSYDQLPLRGESRNGGARVRASPIISRRNAASEIRKRPLATSESTHDIPIKRCPCLQSRVSCQAPPGLLAFGSPDASDRADPRQESVEVLQRGALWDKILRTTDKALASGALQPIPTAFEFIEDAGVSFLVRVVTGLAHKANLLREAPVTSLQANPFLPYERAMFVAHLSKTHVCLLNKYKVVDQHVLIVTRAFEHQESRLTRKDFEALWVCMAEFEGLGFYNSGAAAGASQPHKHLQLVPLPLPPPGPSVPIESLFASLPVCGGMQRCGGLDFEHVLAPLTWEPDQTPASLARGTLALYNAMLAEVGIAPPGKKAQHPSPYNLLLTRRWMLLVPRKLEFFGSISLNALAFAGALLVRNPQQLEELKKQGPMAALRHVATRREKAA